MIARQRFCAHRKAARGARPVKKSDKPCTRPGAPVRAWRGRTALYSPLRTQRYVRINFARRVLGQRRAARAAGATKLGGCMGGVCCLRAPAGTHRAESASCRRAVRLTGAVCARSRVACGLGGAQRAQPGAHASGGVCGGVCCLRAPASTHRAESASCRRAVRLTGAVCARSRVACGHGGAQRAQPGAHASGGVWGGVCCLRAPAGADGAESASCQRAVRLTGAVCVRSRVAGGCCGAIIDQSVAGCSARSCTVWCRKCPVHAHRTSTTARQRSLARADTSRRTCIWAQHPPPAAALLTFTVFFLMMSTAVYQTMWRCTSAARRLAGRQCARHRACGVCLLRCCRQT